MRCGLGNRAAREILVLVSKKTSFPHLSTHSRPVLMHNITYSGNQSSVSPRDINDELGMLRIITFQNVSAMGDSGARVAALAPCFVWIKANWNSLVIAV